MARKRKSGWTYTPTAQHRARLLENLRKAWQAPRRKRPRVSEAQREAARRALKKARDVLRARGWPHSEKQRAAARETVKKAHAAIRAHGIPTTEARRRAALINLAKANAILREQGYPRTDKQKEAARANLRIAHEASRLPENYARYHKHKLKHGLQARKLDELLMLYAEMREEERERQGEGRAGKRQS